MCKLDNYSKTHPQFLIYTMRIWFFKKKLYEQVINGHNLVTSFFFKEKFSHII
jgi:hypothetical protein